MALTCTLCGKEMKTLLAEDATGYCTDHTSKEIIEDLKA